MKKVIFNKPKEETLPESIPFGSIILLSTDNAFYIANKGANGKFRFTQLHSAKSLGAEAPTLTELVKLYPYSDMYVIEDVQDLLQFVKEDR